MKEWYLLIILQILIILFSYLHFNSDRQTSLASHNDETKVFSPDWGITADLISLGVKPMAVADQNGYKTWVVQPPIPKESIDIGLRNQPNQELMASLYPDIIIDNEIYEDNRLIYNKNIITESIKYGRDFRKLDDIPQWSTYKKDLIKLGEYVNKKKVAQDYLIASHQQILQAGTNIRKKLGDNRQFLIVNMSDTKELGIYNRNHPINLAMTMMDLELISMGALSQWGMSSVNFHKIYDVPKNTCLVIVEPMNPFEEHEIKSSLIWQQSEFSKVNACVYRMKSIWMYGGFTTVKRFALELEQEITNPRKTNLSISTVEEKK